MDINRFTEKLQEAVRSAQSGAFRRGHQQVDVEHLLSALLAQEGGLASGILTKSGASPETVRSRVEQELDKLPQVSGPGANPDQIYITPRLQRTLAATEDEAKRLKD